MKVLWFEVTQPVGYEPSGNVSGSWQDSLEDIVCTCSDVELYVAFESTEHSDVRQRKGITYIPLKTSYSWWERKQMYLDAKVWERKLIPAALQVVERVKPDLIHVFGNEFPFGLLAEQIDIPLVIHIQGSIVSYNNALFPPCYSTSTIYRYSGLNPLNHWHLWQSFRLAESRCAMEQRTWKAVRHFMGRTCWDESLVRTLAPVAEYYHVDEAIRPVFLNTSKRWTPKSRNKLQLVTIGAHTFWKGPDMLLKTAHVLKQLGVDFEWCIAGRLDENIRKVVERKEKTTFAENNVRVMGIVDAEKLVDVLCNATMYVHTAYAENSPNSICEAQCLGVPVVSTHVGGIATLLGEGNDGVLVPANDPWQMANAILRLSADEERLKIYGGNAYRHAHERHNPQIILSELMSCYHAILRNKSANLSSTNIL